MEPAVAAAWRHLGAREGFEVLFLRDLPDGARAEGFVSAVEDGEAWSVRYALVLAPDRATRSAHILGRSAAGEREIRLEADGVGGWLLDGKPAPHVAGCPDVDLEASAFTNAMPVRRLRLDPGDAADAPAVYVRAIDLAVERLDQTYHRLPDDASGRARYDYAGPRFDYRDELVYDEHGLVLDYPGLAARVL